MILYDLLKPRCARLSCLQINLRRHSDILKEPLLECLKSLCSPPKAPVTSPKIPEYVGTLFETAVLLCSGDDDKIKAQTFVEFLPKMIQYLLIVTRHNTDFRKRAIVLVKQIGKVVAVHTPIQI